MSIITDIDTVHAFIESQGVKVHPPIQAAFGLADDNGLYGALVFSGDGIVMEDGRKESVWLSAYMADGHSLQPDEYVTAFGSIFERFQTVKCSVRADNIPAVKRCEKTGFSVFQTMLNEDGSVYSYLFTLTREQAAFLAAS